jgi:hypothetical protein
MLPVSPDCPWFRFSVCCFSSFDIVCLFFASLFIVVVYEGAIKKGNREKLTT